MSFSDLRVALHRTDETLARFASATPRRMKVRSVLAGATALVSTSAAAAIGIALCDRPRRSSRIVGALILISEATTVGIFAWYLKEGIDSTRRQPPRQPTAVLALGSTLAGGEIPPLLAKRLARASVLYLEAAQHGQPPLVIPTGAGIRTESLEADAMEQRLAELGVSREHLIPEREAQDTRSNLVNSAGLLAGQYPAAMGSIVAVTNWFHVPRTFMIVEQLRAEGLCPPIAVVAAESGPSLSSYAVLREFVGWLLARISTR